MESALVLAGGGGGGGRGVGGIADSGKVGDGRSEGFGDGSVGSATDHPAKVMARNIA